MSKLYFFLLVLLALNASTLCRNGRKKQQQRQQNNRQNNQQQNNQQQQQQDTDYKLYYFNNRGKAELSRLIFKAAGVDFQDDRIDRSDNSYLTTSPVGRLPFLEYDGGQILVESYAIARFLAKRFNLAGKDENEQAQADAIVDTVLDLQTLYYDYKFAKDATKKSALEKLYIQGKAHLGRIEKLIDMYSSSTGYCVGDSLTWADLQLYTVTYDIIANQLLQVKAYPGIYASIAAVTSNSRIKQYLRSRATTDW